MTWLVHLGPHGRAVVLVAISGGTVGLALAEGVAGVAEGLSVGLSVGELSVGETTAYAR